MNIMSKVEGGYAQMVIQSHSRNSLWERDPQEILHEITSVKSDVQHRIEKLIESMLSSEQSFETLSKADKTALLQSVAFVLRAESFAQQKQETIAA